MNSTFIGHNNLKSVKNEKDNSTLYSTMLYKDNDSEAPNDDDDKESLPHLLKRLLNTKDFTGGYDDDVASISDTMIVKTDRTSKFPSRLLVKDNEFDSGTMVRSCEGVGLSMSRAVGGWANWDWDTEE
ncbi:hypothetical protein BC332_15182 [Capsicum chinense]|nr:hypothetical protein BC332_15182 [Capsicum chinense]